MVRCIVTAAHCSQEAMSTYTAIQGRDVLSDTSTGKESKISDIWVDPQYGKEPGHDVAVMTLTTPFDGVPTLALETDKAADAAGAASVVYGWGETEGTGPANTFQKVDVPVLGDAYCHDGQRVSPAQARGAERRPSGEGERGRASCPAPSFGAPPGVGRQTARRITP